MWTVKVFYQFFGWVYEDPYFSFPCYFSNSIKGRKWLYWWFLVLDFSIEWIKYKFGIFDEFGVDGGNSKLYPKFYQKSRSGEIVMNSCANEKITGDFGPECLAAQNCSVDNGQEIISSSLLFSRDKVHFPKVIIWTFFHSDISIHRGSKTHFVFKNFCACLSYREDF